MEFADIIQEASEMGGVSPDVIDVAVNLLLAAFTATVVSIFYENFGTSLSNRAYLSKNFVLLCVTTALIITVIKTSITLSLGLVGALSIVRFRTAIKEPEELGYIFLIIAVGIGFGADMALLTGASVSMILGIIFIEQKFKRRRRASGNNIFLNIKIEAFQNEDFVFLRRVLSEKKVAMKKYEERNGDADIVLSMAPINFDEMQHLRDEIGVKKGIR